MNNNPLNDVHTLSHTTWNCKYHIVFAPKYRRKVFYDNSRSMSRSHTYASRNTAENDCIRVHGISEREKQYHDISKVGKHEIQVQKQIFRCRGYYVDTAGKNDKVIEAYIKKPIKRR